MWKNTTNLVKKQVNELLLSFYLSSKTFVLENRHYYTSTPISGRNMIYCNFCYIKQQKRKKECHRSQQKKELKHTQGFFFNCACITLKFCGFTKLVEMSEITRPPICKKFFMKGKYYAKRKKNMRSTISSYIRSILYVLTKR